MTAVLNLSFLWGTCVSYCNFNLKNVLWAELPASHFSKLCNPKMSAKNDFQMNLLFSNQFSDYGTNVNLYLPGRGPLKVFTNVN